VSELKSVSFSDRPCREHAVRTAIKSYAAFARGQV